MSEYKGKGKGKGKEERINIDTVLDEFNRLALGKSRGRGSNDPAPNERETMQEKPPNKKKNKVVLKNQKNNPNKKLKHSIGKTQKRRPKDAMDTT